MGRTISWISAGAASAVASKFAILDDPETILAYCETGAEHPDNERFLADCEHWLGRSITRIKSAEFTDTWAVWEKRRYLSGFNGAPCTSELKVAPRMDFQLPSDTHVFGYTADKADTARARRMLAEYPLMKQLHPLIERGLTKASVLAIIEGAGIELPVMYRLGFHNNNCIPCVKATSPSYWAAIRKHFPAEFERMARLSRELNARLVILRQEVVNGKRKNVRGFIDEIPADQPIKDPIAPACDFLCHGAAQEIGEAA